MQTRLPTKFLASIAPAHSWGSNHALDWVLFEVFCGCKIRAGASLPLPGCGFRARVVTEHMYMCSWCNPLKIPCSPSPAACTTTAAGAAICEPRGMCRHRAQRCAQPDKIDLHLAHDPYCDYPSLCKHVWHPRSAWKQAGGAGRQHARIRTMLLSELIFLF